MYIVHALYGIEHQCGSNISARLDSYWNYLTKSDEGLVFWQFESADL